MRRQTIIKKRKEAEERKRNQFEPNNTKPKKGELEVLYTMKVHGPVLLLDFIMDRLKNLPKSTVKHYLSNKQILVNGSCITQFNFPLYKEDVVVVAKYAQKQQRKLMQAKAQNKLEIIYEDEEIIVINKPSGLLSIESDTEKAITAYKMVEDYVRRKDKTLRVVIVHRIDRDTSGVLLFAKNEEVKNMLFKHWNDIVSKREYIAICEGQFKEKEGTVQSYLMQNQFNMVYSTHDSKNGKLAITHYKVMKENQDYSMLDVNIDTGRKNQIRVHMKDLGHKIVGDNKYGEEGEPLFRLGLHAYKLEFTHPKTKKLMSFKAKIPACFNKLFNKKEEE